MKEIVFVGKETPPVIKGIAQVAKEIAAMVTRIVLIWKAAAKMRKATTVVRAKIAVLFCKAGTTRNAAVVPLFSKAHVNCC